MPNQAETNLPYARHCLSQADSEAVLAVLQSGQLTQGETIPAFERQLCDVTGAAHAVAVCNGSAALATAAFCYDYQAGDAVIVPAVTFAATANAFALAGAQIIFADVDPMTGLMTAETAKEAIAKAKSQNLTPRTLVAVSLCGSTPDLSTLQTLAKDSGMNFYEDAAHSLGGQYRSGDEIFKSASCQHTDGAMLSFHPSKVITCGEGGAFLTNDADLAQKARAVRVNGIIRPPSDTGWLYDQMAMGLNFRLSDLHAALGLSQLGRLEEFIAKRRELAQLYRQSLKNTNDLRLPQEDDHSAWHLFVVHFENEQRRNAAHLYLKERGIGTQVHYRPLYQFSHYNNEHPKLDGAEAWAGGCLSLPLFPAMTQEDVEKVIKSVQDFLSG